MRLRFGIKLALFAGFGGLLALMALAGFDFIRALRQIQSDNAQITQTYLKRHRLLEQIRSSLYLSSTLVRDYLLESSAEGERNSIASLHRLREEMAAALRQYGAAIRPEQEKPFSELQSEIQGYWNTLEPVFGWTPQERRSQGSLYMQGQVFPRRTQMVGIADKVESFNEIALANGGRRTAELFAGLQQRVIGTLALALGFGTLLAGVTVVHILGMEKERRERYNEIQRAQDELKRLSARLVEAQEQERQAISRELHDQVGQSLNALRVDLGNLAAVTPPHNREAHEFLNTARGLADESIKAIRNMALLLRPSMLDDLGLVPALGWQARELSRRTGIRVDLIADDVPEELPDDHKTCVFRVVQEALHNVERHAEAHKVRIVVDRQHGSLLITIQDDGRGFDVARIRGLGLLGMEERAKYLGGTFQVRSQPGKGTVLNVSLPLTPLHLQETAISL